MTDDDMDDAPTPVKARPDWPERRARTTGGIPLIAEFSEESSRVTDPVQWLEGDLSPKQRDIADRSARDPGSATPWGQFVKLTDRVDEREEKWRRRDREIECEFDDLRRAVTPERIAAIEALAKAAKWIKWGIRSVVVLLAGSAVTLYVSFRNSEREVGAEGARMIERDHKIERLEKDFDKLGERLEKAIDQIHIELGRRPTSLLDTSTRADDSALAMKGIP